MPIENNLPVIFDTATQTEDGLMSYQDKIKLDNMDGDLADKLGKTDKIKSSQLDTSTDAAKIQPANLSDAVKRMMTGQSSVEATVPNNGVTTEKMATNAVTVDKIDKRVLLANVVSPRPLNFAFDTKKISITIPQGSLLLTDAVTKRVLVTGVDTRDVTVNINYPTQFDGLNYIVSAPSGTLSLINHRKVSSITNTNSIMALVSLSTTFEATVVMNGNYTINGLAQGIGTESAALLGNGKIVFDQTTGIIDFTQATQLYLIIGGILKQTIQAQASIRLANYAEDSIYSLYWDNATSSLKTALATVSNVDTDIAKIAIIKDGRIIPFVNTGIFYSKPSIDSPYYTETFETINNISLASNTPLNILVKTEQKLQFPDETYVCLNEQSLLVANEECYYTNREGLHYILFDLDDNTLSCRHYKEDKDESKKTIVVGTMWISAGKFPEVTGNFQFTVDGKTPYQDDLSNAEESIAELQDIISTGLSENAILAGDELFMIEGEELPIYTSSLLVKDREGIKPVIRYNKKGVTTAPRTEFFSGSILLDPAKFGSTATLLADDKYNLHEYLSKEVKVNKVPSNYKNGQAVKVLCLGDELFSKTAYYVKNKLTSLGLTPTMLGTMVNDGVYGEGRKGWFYSTFVGASGRGIEEGKITPQTSKGSSSILLNPFLRVANADDKANRPNDCYRATGAYVEKNYYNDTDKNGAFYIFDFARYLELQGIETPDVVVVAIKPEDAITFAGSDVVTTNMTYLKQLVAGIRTALPNTVIALVPQYGMPAADEVTWEVTSEMVEETVSYVSKLSDSKIRVIPSWLHMCREFHDTSVDENGKLELTNSIVSFIMNI